MGNQNSGRRPDPTALTVLRGNPSRKKLNVNEVVPPSGDVVKPSGLSAVGAAVWDELAPICLAMKTLTRADVRPFATLCELQATMQTAAAHKDDRGLLSLRKQDEDDPNSDLVVVVDNVLKLERDTANALRPYYALFGLEPVSRARIQVPKDAELPASKWVGVLK